jgi:serine/threonine-protein phosphatase 2A catalytic subunit
MPLACLIGARLFGVHGGLSPCEELIHQIDALDRRHEVPAEGVVSYYFSFVCYFILLYLFVCVFCLCVCFCSCFVFCAPSHVLGPICDLIWSDPDDRAGWGVSPRGAGFTFGTDVTTKWTYQNDLILTVRAHQLVMEGFNYSHEQQLLTLFSAPNYCYRCGNMAAIMEVDENHRVLLQQFESAPRNEVENEKQSAAARALVSSITNGYFI